MNEKYEDIQEGRENDTLTIKSKQCATILEDNTYLLIASDEKGFTASANYETPKDLANLIMEFAAKHKSMMDAVMIIVKKVIQIGVSSNFKN